MLFDGDSGAPLACIDGTALTLRKTAGDSALGAKHLARDDVEHLLMVGAGAMAPHLIRAHCAVRPSLRQRIDLESNCRSGSGISRRVATRWRHTAPRARTSSNPPAMRI